MLTPAITVAAVCYTQRISPAMAEIFNLIRLFTIGDQRPISIKAGPYQIINSGSESGDQKQTAPAIKLIPVVLRQTAPAVDDAL